MLLTRKTHPLLWEKYPPENLISRALGVHVDAEEYNEYLKEADTSVRHLSKQEKETWAAFNAMHHPGFHDRHKADEPAHTIAIGKTLERAIVGFLIYVVLWGLALLFLVGHAHAQDDSGPNPTVTNLGNGHIAMDINCPPLANCPSGGGGGSGGTAADQSSFTPGTSSFTPAGGAFNDSLSAISSGTWATFRITAFRALHSNLRDSSGNEYNSSNPFPVMFESPQAVSQSGSPWGFNLLQLNSVSLGSPTAYGTAPTGNVFGVNAFISNFPSGFNVNNSPTVKIQDTNANQVNSTADNSADTNAVTVKDQQVASAYPTGLTLGNKTNSRQGKEGLAWTANLPSLYPASFSASATVASAASATDIAVLPGVATANTSILVTRVKVSCTQTTAGNITLRVIKRSTADSAGTSSAMTVVPDDANQGGTPAAPLTYTANPTTGTAVGDVDGYFLGCMATGTASPNDIYILNRLQKPIVLRGTAQELAVNLNGATVSGGSFRVTFEWIETTTP